MAGRAVVAAVLVKAQRVLLCHRTSDRDWFPNVWDLPGGHVESRESAAEALARELEEELGIIIEPLSMPPDGRPIERDFDLSVWIVTKWSGHATIRDAEEHDEIAWFSAADIANVPVAHSAYRPMLVEALRNGS
jgi:8-oxo-dGTP diphosphatase